MSETPTADQIELYSQGSCHIFAAAAVLEYGGSFVIASDSSEPVWTFEDDSELYSVVHVLALLPGKDGQEPIIRDIFGDRRCTRKELREELAGRFDLWEQDITLQEVDAQEMLFHLDDPDGVFSRAFNVSVDPDWEHDRPLCELFEGDIEEVRKLNLITAQPGSRDLIPVAVEPEIENLEI